MDRCCHARFERWNPSDGKRCLVRCKDCGVVFQLPAGIASEDTAVRVPFDGVWREADWYFREKYPHMFDIGRRSVSC